jgi:hypothetical protein
MYTHLNSVFFLPIFALIRKNLFAAIETQAMLVKRYIPEAAGICFRQLQVRTGVSSRLATPGMFVQSYDLLLAYADSLIRSSVRT